MADNPPDERDESGRFRKGKSGNPAGRPRKKPDAPRSFEEMLADELQREVTFEDAAGQTRTGTQLEMVCANIIANLKEAKPKEAIAVLQEFKKLGILQESSEQIDDDLAAIQELSKLYLAMHKVDPEGARDMVRKAEERRGRKFGDSRTEAPKDETDEDGEDDES